MFSFLLSQKSRLQYGNFKLLGTMEVATNPLRCTKRWVALHRRRLVIKKLTSSQGNWATFGGLIFVCWCAAVLQQNFCFLLQFPLFYFFIFKCADCYRRWSWSTVRLWRKAEVHWRSFFFLVFQVCIELRVFRKVGVGSCVFSYGFAAFRLKNPSSPLIVA